jgi:hypothetical protein
MIKIYAVCVGVLMAFLGESCGWSVHLRTMILRWLPRTSWRLFDLPVDSLSRYEQIAALKMWQLQPYSRQLSAVPLPIFMGRHLEIKGSRGGGASWGGAIPSGGLNSFSHLLKQAHSTLVIRDKRIVYDSALCTYCSTIWMMCACDGIVIEFVRHHTVDVRQECPKSCTDFHRHQLSTALGGSPLFYQMKWKVSWFQNIPVRMTTSLSVCCK